MELWIRGQRKGLLIKINSHIRISECNGYYCLLQDEYYLGKYSTKERAVEILDEIQRLLEKDKFEEDRYCCDKLTKAIVYEMPKD